MSRSTQLLSTTHRSAGVGGGFPTPGKPASSGGPEMDFAYMSNSTLEPGVDGGAGAIDGPGFDIDTGTSF